jgi:hypothetical protein
MAPRTKKDAAGHDDGHPGYTATYYCKCSNNTSRKSVFAAGRIVADTSNAVLGKWEHGNMETWKHGNIEGLPAGQYGNIE